jgi:hypothetical protein
MFRPSAVIGTAIGLAIAFGVLPFDFGTFGLILAVTAVVAVAETAWDVWRGRQSTRWLPVPGTITAAWQTRGRRRRSHVRYEYRVGDEVFEGRRISFGAGAAIGGLFSLGGGVMERYPVGQGVSVYIDPTNPRHAVLEPGVRIANFAGALVMLGAVAFIAFQFRSFGFEFGFNFDPRTVIDRPDPAAQPPALATRAAVDPTVIAAQGVCIPPSQAAIRAESAATATTEARMTTCVIGYVSLARTGAMGGEIHLDDLGAEPGNPGVVVLSGVGFGSNSLPPAGAVVQAWGWFQPADDFPCDRVGAPCMLVTPFQISVLLEP